MGHLWFFLKPTELMPTKRYCRAKWHKPKVFASQQLPTPLAKIVEYGTRVPNCIPPTPKNSAKSSANPPSTDRISLRPQSKGTGGKLRQATSHLFRHLHWINSTTQPKVPLRFNRFNSNSGPAKFGIRLTTRKKDRDP